MLGVVRSHPLHGHALVQALEQGLGPAAGLTRPSTYAILHRLAERGWIEGEREQEGARPEREVYTITSEGERGYRSLVDAVIGKAAPEGTLPLAVLIAHLDALPPEARAVRVRAWLRDRHDRLAALQSFPPHDGLAGASLALMLHVARAEVEILEGLLRETSAH